MERLRIVGEIVVDNASDVLAELLETIKRDPEHREVDAIEIDCSRIRFIDSSDLAMLVKLRTGREGSWY